MKPQLPPIFYVLVLYLGSGYAQVASAPNSTGVTDAIEEQFTLFTIANTNIGVDFEAIPYRERYLWENKDAPCHSFNVNIPDEMEEMSVVALCIYRPNLVFPDDTKLFILNSEDEEETPTPTNKVLGYVMNSPSTSSSIYGRIEDKNFYGEISFYSEASKTNTIFVIEEIRVLNKLLRNRKKTLKHMLTVMQADNEGTPAIYNAVVTRGSSLVDFFMLSSLSEIHEKPFLVLSTNHNSYFMLGEPIMQVDDLGHILIESGNNKLTVDNNDVSIHLTTNKREYTFRPHGRTIITEGSKVTTLQEHEGAIAVTAFSPGYSDTYDCVLPTPATDSKRKEGYVCRVCVAVDSLFSKYFIDVHTKAEFRDNDTPSKYLADLIDSVSWIFRPVDFDEDQKPDNIGLDYDSQTFEWSYPGNEHQENLSEQDVIVLFQSLRQYELSDCCLGIGFTMKNLPDRDFARRALKGEQVPSISAVCSGNTGKIPNNLLIISGNSKAGNFKAMTESQLIYLTAHQIAAAFGAPTDGAGDDACDQFTDDHKTTRHFLMWPDVLRNTTLKEQTLSTCSKKEMIKTLSTCKSACFEENRHPFCGNGIVEEGEECDCGSEYNCKLQTCCFARMGKHPCRKSGIGCSSSSSPPSIVPESSMLFVTFGLIAMEIVTKSKSLLFF